MEIKDFAPGTVVKFECEGGLQLRGTPYRQCMMNGTWSGVDPWCEGNVCPPPKSIQHGQFRIEGRGRKSRLIYKCDEGYVLQGRRIRRCRRNFKWSHSDPSCIIQPTCVDPGEIANGERYGSCCVMGSRLHFECHSGYEMAGPGEIKCVGRGHWDQAPPKCTAPIYCEEPGELENGRKVPDVHGGIYQPGSTMKYACNRGYYFATFEENVEFTCLKSGLWDDMLKYHTCLVWTCPQPLAPYDGVILEEDRPTFQAGDIVHYRCAHGFKIFGPSSRECSVFYEGWSGWEPACRPVRCPDPRWPENGRRIGSAFHLGGSVLFTCFSGFRHLGSVMRTCQANGRWSGTTATCDKGDTHCPVPVVPLNGYKNGHGYNVGDSVRFSCKPGHVLLGSEERKCLSTGEWSGDQPRCEDPETFEDTAEIAKRLKQVTDALSLSSSSSKTAVARQDGDRLASNGLDVFLIFDSTRFIGNVSFRRGLEFAKHVIYEFGVSSQSSGTQFGAITLDVDFTTPALEKERGFHSYDHSSEQEMLDALDNILYTGDDGVGVDVALGYLSDVMIPKAVKKRGSANSTKTVIFFTDGNHILGEEYKQKAEELKNRHDVRIITFGFTASAHNQTLRQLASRPTENNVFILRDYFELRSLRDEMNNMNIDYSSCGKTMAETDLYKIDHSESSSEQTWPWVVGIFSSETEHIERNQIPFVCTGTLVDEYWVLSSASCLEGRAVGKAYVKIGSHKVEVLHVHTYDQNQTSAAPGYNIALWYLAERVSFSPYVRKICLPNTLDLSLFDYDDLTTSRRPGMDHLGVSATWRQTADQPRIIQKLQKIRPPDDCQSRRQPTNEQELCAVAFNSTSAVKSGCHQRGDGALFRRLMKKESREQIWIQIGVAAHSMSTNCRHGDSNILFTKLDHLMSWIQDHITRSKTE
ncbi:complement factor B-like [Lingula anatina]|uniref:C3/C5 convertase n=1 Tax=Lingula anatina TaxID=7574 RepID=A0A1S3K102_LINAN|nr:complement factor B-like [Lingula anatina]|eukprot:XP_013415956.1 complement factor B-like [Lingula anatina]